MSVAKPIDGPAKASMILTALKAAGINLVATLPDLWLSDLIDAIAADPEMTLVRVTREEEAVGICAGAYLGGRKAAVVAQNAGLLLSVNALAGLAMHHQIPVLLLLAYRGGAEDNQYYQVYKGRVTVPVLNALNLPHHFVTGPSDYKLVVMAQRQADLARVPVVLLFDRLALLGDDVEPPHEADLCGKLVRKHLDPRSLVYCALGSASRTWRAQEAPHLSYYGSDPMGIALPAALGLALARPERPVLFIGGDGDLVMGLGCLLTVVGAKPANLKLLIFDNGRYETGGGQSLAGRGAYSLPEIAKGAGFAHATSVNDPAAAEAAIAGFLAEPGLAFLAVGIDPEASPYPPAPATSQAEERAHFVQRLSELPR